MNFSFRTNRRTIIIAAILGCIGTSPMAQPDSVEYELSPIIVTASRMADTWIRMPIAASVVQVGDFQSTKGAGIDEILRGVPGLFVQSRSGNQDVRLSIRGFGSRGAGERSNAGTSRGVRILLDGFPITEPDGRTAFDLIDQASVDRVEVVRSNSSTSWGNASGGVINFISASSGEAPELTTGSTFGNFGYRKDMLSAHSRIGTGQFALTFTNTNSDGWRRHSGSARSFLNANLKSLIGRASSVEVSLSATSNLFKIPGPLTRAQFDSDPRQAQGDAANYNPSYMQRDERRFNRLGRLGVKLAHECDKNTGFEVTAFAGPKYLQRSERNTYRDFTRYHIGGSSLFHHISPINPSLSNSVVAGLDGAYQDGAILFYNLDQGQRGDTVRADKREGARNFGAFVEDRIAYLDRYLFNFRLRYDDISYYYDDYLDSRLDDRKSFSRVTPMFGFTFVIDSSRSVYASIGGGVEVPAGNETDPPSTFGEDALTSLNPLLNPIKSITYEIGTKCATSMRQGRFISRCSYDVSAYWINVIDDIIPYRGGRFYFTAGKTRRLGLELGGSVDLQGGVNVNVSTTFSHNRYIKYVVDSVHYGVAGATANYDGFEMAGVPWVNYSARIVYSPLFARQVFVEGTIQGVGSYYADDANIVVVQAYRTIDLAVGAKRIALLQGRPFFQLSLGIENLLNKRYAASAFINPDRSSSSGEPIFLEPGQPRNWIASVALKWSL